MVKSTVDKGGGGEEGKVRHKSLKSRPGAGKKREKVLAAERERFARNLGLMAGGDGEGHGQGESGSRERWAAIRRHIETNVERRVPDAGSEL